MRRDYAETCAHILERMTGDPARTKQTTQGWVVERWTGKWWELL